MREFRSADGTPWHVVVQMPGASNAMILFRNPTGSSSGLDRYNWLNLRGVEARNVTARVDPSEELKKLSDSQIEALFRRSMPVTSRRPRYVVT